MARAKPIKRVLYLRYDEPNKEIVIKAVNSYKKKADEETTVRGSIDEAIMAMSLQAADYGTDIPTLVNNGLIVLDSTMLKSDGIITVDASGNYKKCVFEIDGDYKIVELSKKDKKNLGIGTSKGGIRNLKVRNGVLAVLVVASLVMGGSTLIKSLKGRGSNSNQGGNDNPTPPDNRPGVETQGEYESQDESALFASQETVLERYYNGEIENEEIRTLIENINSLCGAYYPCEIDYLVPAKDRDTVRTINDYRNQAINNGAATEHAVDADTMNLIDEYVNYILGGSTMFFNSPVSAFNSLDLESQYAIVAEAETVLQLLDHYDYVLGSRQYDKASLIEEFDKIVDSIVRQMESIKGRTR